VCGRAVLGSEPAGLLFSVGVPTPIDAVSFLDSPWSGWVSLLRRIQGIGYADVHHEIHRSNDMAIVRTTIVDVCECRSWRNRRVPAPSAFSRFPPVHEADLEGQQRVDLARSPSGRRMAGVCALGPCTASSSHGGNPRAVTGASTRVVSLAKAPTDSMMRTTKLAPPVPLPPGKWWQAVDRQLFQFRRRRPSAQIMRRALCWCSRCCWCCSRWRSPHARRRRGARPSPLRLRSKLNQLDRFRRKRTLQTTLRMFQLARD
jgi:hypothetical protein